MTEQKGANDANLTRASRRNYSAAAHYYIVSEAHYGTAAVCERGAFASASPMPFFCVIGVCVRRGESNLIQACEDSFQFVYFYKFARSSQLSEERKNARRADQNSPSTSQRLPDNYVACVCINTILRFNYNYSFSLCVGIFEMLL
jgi:hypothetical protein